MKAVPFHGDAPALIADHLSHDDFSGACAAAAQLQDPRAHRDAMIAINRAMRERSSMKFEFSLEEKEALLSHYECDKRVSDDEEEDAPAIAVCTFVLTLPSELLAGFSPTLRSALFCKDGAVTHDLANVTQDAPDVRFKDWIYPIRIKKSWEGATVRIENGLDDLVLADASITTFHVTPKAGSVFILEFTARSKQEDSSVFGRLADMLKTNVTISLEPPETPAPQKEGDGNPRQASMIE